MQVTKNYWELFKPFFITGLEGSTYSGKTWSVLQYVVTLYNTEAMIKSNTPETFRIVGETSGFVRTALFDKFKELMKTEKQWNDNQWHDTRMEYTFAGGHVVSFIAIDKPSKAHGVRSTRTFFNEAQNLKWDIVRQMIGRTEKQVIFDFNPVDTFYYHTEILENPLYAGMVNHVHSTMIDAIDFIPPMTLRTILANAEKDSNYRTVYVLGQRGNREGLIYSNYQVCDKIPEEYEWQAVGIDFGYTNDPSVGILIRYAKGQLWERELFYEPDLDITPTKNNRPSITQRLEEAGIPKNCIIIPDSEDPRAIDNIMAYYPHTYKIKKPKVDWRIQLVRKYTVNIESTSLNLLREKRNWSWKQNPHYNGSNAKYLNEPDRVWKHGQDAEGYVATYMLGGYQEYSSKIKGTRI